MRVEIAFALVHMILQRQLISGLTAGGLDG
ncbi:hypothetical protein BH24ACT17_BH24ACT17_00770 [soil metagenome]